MLVREIIEAKGWEDGNGWTYCQTIIDLTFELDLEKFTEDWDWLLVEVEPAKGSDVLYTARFYSADDKDLLCVLAERSVWESELYKGDEYHD